MEGRPIRTTHGMPDVARPENDFPSWGGAGRNSGVWEAATALGGAFAPEENFRGEGIDPLTHDKFTIPYD